MPTLELTKMPASGLNCGFINALYRPEKARFVMKRSDFVLPDFSKGSTDGYSHLRKLSFIALMLLLSPAGADSECRRALGEDCRVHVNLFTGKRDRSAGKHIAGERHSICMLQSGDFG